VVYNLSTTNVNISSIIENLARSRLTLNVSFSANIVSFETKQRHNMLLTS